MRIESTPALVGMLASAAAVLAAGRPAAASPQTPAPTSNPAPAAAKLSAAKKVVKPAKPAKPIPAPQDDRQAIEDAYADVDAATASKNVAGIFAHTTPDFIILGKGKDHITRETMARVLAHNFQMTQSVEPTTEVKSAVLQDGGILALVQRLVISRLIQPQTGQTTTMKTIEVSRDFWIKTDKGWMEKRSRVLGGDFKMEGGGFVLHDVSKDSNNAENQ